MRTLNRSQIGENKLIANHSHSCGNRDGGIEHGTRIYKGMEFSALAAWIHSIGEFQKQPLVELAAYERLLKFCGVHTSQLGSQASGNHLFGQSQRRPAPNGEYGLQSGSHHLFFPVGAYIFEKQIAKRDAFDTFGDCLGTSLSHQ